MANKNLFRSASPSVPEHDTINEAGGRAYSRSDEAALAQYAVTGTFTQTYYMNAQSQLDEALKVAAKVDPGFLAKTAIYAREKGFMKDMPAFLLASLSTRDTKLLARAFPRVVDNGKILKNYVQIIRSGVTGRKSLGSAPKKAVQRWIQNRGTRLLWDSIGDNPTMGDVLRMVHPRPGSPEQAALFGFILGYEPMSMGDFESLPPDKRGKKYCFEHLPKMIKDYMAFKAGESTQIPNVPFQLLTSLPLSTEVWTEIAKNSGWHQARINLNTFNRHGVFKDPKMVDLIAKKLADSENIEKAKVFPYQLMTAYQYATGVPGEIREALQDALEMATKNVPVFEGSTVVAVDTSGSMGGPITGYRRGATSVVRCVDVAALFASCILRNNHLTKVMPFDTHVHKVSLNPRDSVLTNAQKLARGGGGTNCAAVLHELNLNHQKADMVVYVSDNESWVDTVSPRYRYYYGTGTGMMQEWALFKKRNKHAKLVCIDLTPSPSIQMKESPDVLNIGGFSDNVFTLVKMFAEGRLHPDAWVGEINQIEF